MKAIEDYRGRVNKALRDFLDKKLAGDSGYSKETRRLLENIREYSLRDGKRVRPIVAIFAYKCFKECDMKTEDELIKASISLELMQSYLLVHDDIIDKAELRRGGKSFHETYSGGDFGNNIAILAGNLCSGYMHDAILESGFSEKSKLEASRYLTWIDERENYGQALDILPGFEVSEEMVMKIYELKTATYTSQGPIYIGGALAGAQAGVLEKLQTYGTRIGIAFQIQDDILGVYGKVEETGKPNDSDIREGKKTLLITKALELANNEDKEFLLNNYGKSDISEEKLEQIREIIRKIGALDYSKKKARELIEQGKRSLENLEIRDEGKNFLTTMADYVQSMA
jgi:geranylgeranyl diphosphate synthase, type I